MVGQNIACNDVHKVVTSVSRSFSTTP